VEDRADESAGLIERRNQREAGAIRCFDSRETKSDDSSESSEVAVPPTCFENTISSQTLDALIGELASVWNPWCQTQKSGSEEPPIS
jgi:hypothetical protein